MESRLRPAAWFVIMEGNDDFFKRFVKRAFRGEIGGRTVKLMTCLDGTDISGLCSEITDLSFCAVSFDGRYLRYPKYLEMEDGSFNHIGHLHYLEEFTGRLQRLPFIRSLLRCVKYILRGFQITNVDHVTEHVLKSRE
jgi:hypothetical protein